MTIDEIKTTNKNIRFLRQWLNEDRISDPERMVTDEMIIFWLTGEEPNNDDK